MKIVLLGGASFLGKNLAISLIDSTDNEITAVDEKRSYFNDLPNYVVNKINIRECVCSKDTNFDELLNNQQIVYHLLSTVIPATSNKNISQEIGDNIIGTAKLLDACVRNGVKKVVFFSSGGAVYGKDCECPIHESTLLQPITSYGLQKVTIEKMLYLYNYIYDLDYTIIRLSNPYGPYQRPNGVLGVVTTFIYRALNKQKIKIFGNGEVVRDFIYVEDAIKAILNVVSLGGSERVFNIGSGIGTSINEVVQNIHDVLGVDIIKEYMSSRKADVPQNYLDVTKYEQIFGRLSTTDMMVGIKKTANFLQNMS